MAYVKIQYPHPDNGFGYSNSTTVRLTYTEVSPPEVPSINELVREALEKPRREAEEARRVAEVNRRVELAEKIGEDNYDFGTVLRWTRRFGEDTEHTKSIEYRYAAIKTGDGKWYVTGQQQMRTNGWKWYALVEWMVTGVGTVENLEVASAWNPIA